MSLILILISIVFPPLSVYLSVGLTSVLALNLLLTCLLYIPGIIHALYITTHATEYQSYDQIVGHVRNNQRHRHSIESAASTKVTTLRSCSSTMLTLNVPRVAMAMATPVTPPNP